MDTYVTIQGNLCADPVMRSTASGAAVANIRVASSGRKFDKALGEFRDGDAIFMSVSCWRGLGANVMATLRKGDSVVVLGRLLQRTYDDRQGVRHTVVEIDATALGPDLARCPAELKRPSRVTDAEPSQAASPAGPSQAGPSQAGPSQAGPLTPVPAHSDSFAA